MRTEDALYLASLLHDIGKLATFHKHAERSASLLKHVLNEKICTLIRYHDVRRGTKSSRGKEPRKKNDKKKGFVLTLTSEAIESLKEEGLSENDILMLLAIKAGDSSASGLETTGLYNVKITREYNSLFLPLLNKSLLTQLPISWSDVISWVENFRNKEIDLIRCFLESILTGKDIPDLLLAMSVIPKETRFPYNDVSVLTHSLFTATLSGIFYRLIVGKKENSVNNLLLYRISFDFSKFLREIRRTSEHWNKVFILTEFYDALYHNLLTSDDTLRALYRIFLIPVLPKINALRKWNLLEVSISENLINLIKLFTFNNLVLIQFNNEEYTRFILNEIIDLLSRNNILDLIDLSVTYRELLGKDIISIDEEKISIYLTEFNSILRTEMWSLLKGNADHAFLEFSHNLISLSHTTENSYRFCEFCGNLPASYYPPNTRYILCERCYGKLKELRGKGIDRIRGVLLDDIADEFGYVGLLRIIIDSETIALGSQENTLPIEFIYKSDHLRVPALWNIDRGVESLQNILLLHAVFYNHLIKILELLSNQNIIEKVHHIRAKVLVDEPINEATFGDVYIGNKTYPAIIYPSEKREKQLELIGIHLSELGELTKREFSAKISINTKELPCEIRIVNRYIISNEKRLYPLELSPQNLIVLMPAALLPFALKEISKFYHSVPIMSITSKIFKRKEPLYLILSEIYRE